MNRFRIVSKAVLKLLNLSGEVTGLVEALPTERVKKDIALDTTR
jgi:hypothetical protein